MATKTKSPALSRNQKFANKKAERDKRNEIAALAQKYLDRHQPQDFKIHVVHDAIELRGDTWLVVAEPSRIDAGYEFYDKMAKASMEVEDKEKVSLFFVPVLPPEDD